MTSVANQTLSLYEKFTTLLDPHEVWHALSVLDVIEKKKRFKANWRVVRACALKQATQTQDGSQSFHNVSTKVSSVTCVCMYKDGVCVCVCIPVAFSTDSPLSFQV